MFKQILTIFYFITIVFAQLNITYINENNTLNYDFNDNDTITTTTEYSFNDTKITTTEIYNNNENDTSTTISSENTSLSEYYQDIMTTTTSSNESETMLPDRNDRIDNREAICQPGLWLPVWEPQLNLTIGDRIARGLLYFIILCYLFLGVSIVSDRFMAGIEIITAKEKEVRIRKADGEIQIVVVRIWNGTVANLTLMALGTSAPEILLSIIEIFSKHFQAGDLGPGTIVGSAAYNLLCITALCVFVIPDGEVRKIKHLRVFFITTTFSIFAYVWLYLILSKISPGRVDVWEGLITFLFFPLLVYVSYVADRRLSVFKYLSKEYRMNKRGVMIKVETDAGMEMSDRNGYKSANSNGGAIDCGGGGGGDGDDDATEDMELYYDEYKDLEDARNEYVNALKLLRKQHPDIDLGQLEIMAQEDMINKGPKSRAFYRVQATSKMVGRGNIIKKNAQRNLNELKAELNRVDTIGTHNDDLGIAKISFEPSHYTVMENCGEFEVFVVRQGDFSATVTVDYETEDGSAEAGTDYIYKKGQLIFTPGIVKQKIKLAVIDDDVFEQDEHFYVTLKNVSDNAILSSARMATIMILDDDHGGIFSFAKKDHELIETIGIYEIIVKRSSGARGKVIVPYCTEDATAKAGKDYEEKQGELIFEDNESE